VSRRLLTHILIAVLCWVLFGYYWGLVAQRRVTENTLAAVQLLALIVVVIWAVTTVWIQHNRRRFAGRPDRRTRRTASGAREALAPHDTIGYPVQVIDDYGTLEEADYVEIEVYEDEHVKVFRVPGEVPQSALGLDFEHAEDDDDGRRGAEPRVRDLVDPDGEP
jgi:hypothetical protein